MIANVSALRTVDDVIARMRAIDAELPRRDGVAAFNQVYLEVTERVRDRIGEGFFRDPALAARCSSPSRGRRRNTSRLAWVVPCGS
jgi:hypothetical protein